MTSALPGAGRGSERYGIVLGLVIVAFLFAALAPDGHWSESVLLLLQTTTLVCAFRAGAIRLPSRGRALVIGVSVAAAIANVVSTARTTSVITTLLAGVVTLGIAVTIGVGILGQDGVNRQSVRGAIAIYLLLGLLFVFLYDAVAASASTSLFAQATDGTRALRTYFSYVTLATLGYGDYSPATVVGRMLAVVEALLGQLYLVTIVAVIVSRLGRDRKRAAR
jgi:hypothetical protein